MFSWPIPPTLTAATLKVYAVFGNSSLILIILFLVDKFLLDDDDDDEAVDINTV